MRKKASGESITPMYELEIRNSKNKKVASYSFVDKGIYISDILIDDNMVTLNRVEKSGGYLQRYFTGVYYE